jgi:RecB family endonuclease NucS
MASLDLENFSEQLRRAVSSREFIVIVCLCEADYIGRARSFLEKGERILMIKEDTSFLIHRSTELEPVNWQPPPNYIGVATGQDHIVLTVKRIRKPEKIVARIYNFRSFFSGRLQDKGGFHMHLSEKEISETLWKHPEFVEKGFRITSTEVREETGVIDVVGVDEKGWKTIVEIKKDRAGLEAARQVLKYARGLGKGVRIMLLAPGVTEEAERLLKKNGVEFRRISIADLTRILLRERSGERKGIFTYINDSDS